MASDVPNLLMLWFHIEACASIIAACLPTLAPLFRGEYTAGSLCGKGRALCSSRFKSSRKCSKSSEANSSFELAQSKRAWQTLPSIKTHTAARGTQEPKNLEVEAGSQDGILVERSFTCDFEGH